MTVRSDSGRPLTDGVETTRCITAAILSDPGSRATNQDSVSFVQPHDPELLRRKGVLAVLADGMGGHAGGDCASKMAVEIVGREYYASSEAPGPALRIAFEKANASIHALSWREPSLEGMGTTCTALVICGNQAIWGHVGDSRLYLLRENELRQLTDDHSKVMDMVRSGLIDMVDARQHRERNIIRRALGLAPDLTVDECAFPMAIGPGDRFVLCSDGLSTMVDDDEIRIAGDGYDACQELIQLAKARGGDDNVSIAWISVDWPREDPPRPDDTPVGSAAKGALRP